MGKFKILIALIVSMSMIYCKIGDRKNSGLQIAGFIEKNKIDQRETVFDIKSTFKNGKLVLTGETSDKALKDKLISELNLSGVKDEIVLLPDSSIDAKKYALVNLSVASFRVQPNVRAEMATQALMGTPLKLLKKSGDWVLAQTPDRYIAWIEMADLTPVDEQEYQAWKNSRRMLFTGDYNTLYESEELTSPVSDVVAGCILELIEAKYKTLKLKLPDGRTGYCHTAGWVDFETFKRMKTAGPDSLLLVAKRFTGRPYLWGGTSCLAMDCSGFTKTVYFLNGMILARDASLQVKYGDAVEPDNYFSNVLPGDLLFFGRKGENGAKDRVTHVALSLGQNEYIHSSGKIKVNSFDPQSPVYSEARRKSLLAVRRILKTNWAEQFQVSANPAY